MNIASYRRECRSKNHKKSQCLFIKVNKEENHLLAPTTLPLNSAKLALGAKTTDQVEEDIVLETAVIVAIRIKSQIYLSMHPTQLGLMVTTSRKPENLKAAALPRASRVSLPDSSSSTKRSEQSAATLKDLA